MGGVHNFIPPSLPPEEVLSTSNASSMKADSPLFAPEINPSDTTSTRGIPEVNPSDTTSTRGIPVYSMNPDLETKLYQQEVTINLQAKKIDHLMEMSNDLKLDNKAKDVKINELTEQLAASNNATQSHTFYTIPTYPKEDMSYRNLRQPEPMPKINYKSDVPPHNTTNYYNGHHTHNYYNHHATPNVAHMGHHMKQDIHAYVNLLNFCKRHGNTILGCSSFVVSCGALYCAAKSPTATQVDSHNAKVVTELKNIGENQKETLKKTNEKINEKPNNNIQNKNNDSGWSISKFFKP